MSDRADYVVVRPAPDLPEGFLAEYLDGRWFDMTEVPRGRPGDFGQAVAVPTGRFEFREDGAVAEVYEVRP